MDSLVKSAGLPVAAGASLLGAVSYYCLHRSATSATPKPLKKLSTGVSKNSTIVLFFNEGSTQCINLPNHKTDECALTDCPVRHLRTLQRIISKATTSVDVCLYNLNQPTLEKALVDLLRSGKRVRVVVGDRDVVDKGSITRLRSEGAFVVEKISKVPPGGLLPNQFEPSDLLMHHKFVVVDKKILITGSMNWTNKSFDHNYDHIIINVDPYLVNQFTEEFEYLHSTSCDDEKAYSTQPNGQVPFEVIFFRRFNFLCRRDANRKKKCERDDCMFYNYKFILHKIMRATVSVDLCVQQLTTEDLSNELIFLHNIGIKVRVICDKEFSTGTGSQMQYFINSGTYCIEVHRLEGDGSLHHKFVIVDGETLLAGTINWTMQSFFGNYENMLIVEDKDTVRQFVDEFEKLWKTFPAISKV
ncbi:Mitochondrial cardiolipin hydrolase [Frankliniella fusca]|uniref:Mitochondrial cardiolipin hydrolase n=1 Tax=Frankliniella fusca TaxID=407009 RepID=A0AAE1GSG1_9NEOP|nr:Mitochondrial cardiolipin hydrolase [Frankliniella fusca]